MKPFLFAVLLLTSVLFVTSPAGLAAQATSIQQIQIPPLPPFKPQQPKRIQLPNGMIIFLQEDHELPLIDGTAKIRGGSHNEPASKVGLTDIYSEVWRTGGTKTQTGDQLDDFLEVRAAKVETSAGPDSTSISWSCLKGDFEDVFKVFLDVLRNPEFRDEKIDIARKGEYDGISRRNDQVGEIAGREATKLAYGADNPYARVPEYATVAAVTRQDLIDWHHKYVQPNNIILGISGDFDSAALEARLRSVFESWPKGTDVARDEVEYHPAAPGYYLVPKEDVNQSSIQMVALGIKRDNPDYYAVSVLNEAFGGGFSSRLFNDIRTKRGLAYSVGGGIGANFGHTGILHLVMGTKSQSTIEAIQAIREDVENLGKNPITDEEIQHAKDAILNAFIFRLDSPDKILGERMTYEFYGYPADWLDKYQTEIKKVTTAEVNRVAAKYLHADQLAVLVVGNSKEFDKPLSSLGAVKEIDITIPPPPGGEGEADKNSAGNPEGKALAQKVVAAMGGAARVQAVKSLRASIAETEEGQSSDVDVTIVLPDRMHVKVQTPNGPLAIVVTPDSGFMSMEGRGSHSLPSAQKNEMMTQLHHDLIYIAQHVDDPAFTFTAGDSEKIGDVQAVKLDIGGAVPWVRWYVDPQSGRILREDYKGLGQGGPFNGQTDLSDWRTVDGLTLPFVHKNKQDGKESSTAEYKKLEINPAVDSKLFEKSAEGAGAK